VYVQWGKEVPKGGPAKKDHVDMHAGETETSTMLISHPELVYLDRAGSESGADQNHVHLPEDLYTGIWWYAKFPDHYSGDGTVATKELGQFVMNAWINAITEAIRAVKADDASLKLQNEFYEKSRHPLETKQ
jgi:creatinine amidohydrolase